MPDQELQRIAARAESLLTGMTHPGRRATDDPALRSLCAALTSSAAHPLEGYREWPQSVDEQLQRWAAADPPSRLGRLLLALVASLPSRLEQSTLPAPFTDEYRRCASRITERIAKQTPWKHGVDDDVFRKDLALLCLRMVPSVSHVVCRHSGVPRRTLLLPRNLLSGSSVRVVVGLRGRLRPLIENHVHPEMLDRFDEAGREQCYRLVGALLTHWPDAVGLGGTSWYYDSAVGNISPRLGYLRRVPAGHGALFLHVGAEAEATQNAIARSTHRRTMVERGLYRPRNVMMVWPREALMRYVGR
jgi:hypothetical protein